MERAAFGPLFFLPEPPAHPARERDPATATPPEHSLAGPTLRARYRYFFLLRSAAAALAPGLAEKGDTGVAGGAFAFFGFFASLLLRN
jgi:hypothetical protein